MRDSFSFAELTEGRWQRSKRKRAEVSAPLSLPHSSAAGGWYGADKDGNGNSETRSRPSLHIKGMPAGRPAVCIAPLLLSLGVPCRGGLEKESREKGRGESKTDTDIVTPICETR